MARVLVVEDDEQVRTMLRTILERAGYEADEAGDGNEAVSSHRENPADLMIIDIIMPDKEGIETIIEIRKDWPDLPIIAISGGGRESAEAYLEIARSFGVARTFRKPVDRKEMIEAVAELIRC